MSQSEKPVAENKILPKSQISAFQHEIELKKMHLKQLRHQQIFLETIKIEISNIELGIKNKYSSNLTNNPLNTKNLDWPLIYKRTNSHEHCMNQKVAELKNNLKIEESNELRDELSFSKNPVMLTTSTTQLTNIKY